MLSIIIPVKEPEPFLPILISQINKCVEQPHEILVQREKGLGYAVMCGIKKAQGDTIVIMDGDGSHPASAIQEMTKLLVWGYDIVIGSRYAGGATHDTFSRELISRIYCAVAQLLFGLHVKDNMSGFIAAKREVFEHYPINCKSFKFGLELLVKSRSTYHATEYPIVFEKRKLGKSKASPMEAVKTLLLIFRLCMQIKSKF